MVPYHNGMQIRLAHAKNLPSRVIELIIKNSSFTYRNEILYHKGIKTPIIGAKNWTLTVHVWLTCPLHKGSLGPKAATQATFPQ